MIDIMRRAPVIPVLVLDSATDAAMLAERLVAAGLPVIEVTMRTPAAADAIREMAAVDGAIVGAGTVLTPADLDVALAAGARFVVSPGLGEPLAQAARASATPYLPGVATASDIMRALDLGLSALKFFPAEAAGGVAALKALCAPFPMLDICPTGGITAATAPAWLALPQVACVGGSWIVPRGPIDAAAVDAAARTAAALRR